MAQAPGPVADAALAGISVLELTTGVPGGYCGRLLAMLGADVVKVESRRHPDRARVAGPFPGDRPDPDRSGLHRFLHAQERSISLDVGSASGFDVQVSGLARLTGEPGGPPRLVGHSVTDVMAGAMGAVAVLAALHKRDATGRGDHIDLSQIEALTSWSA